jgi:hypothetical protein
MSELYVGLRRFGRRARGKHVRLTSTGPVAQDHGKGEDNLDGAPGLPH